LLATQEIRDFASAGITERLYVIPNGIDVSAYQRETDRVHCGQVRRLAYMGRLVRTKGIFEAIAAVEILHADPQFHDLELRIAGSGADEAAIKRFIQERGLSHCVTLVGPVYGADKVDFLRAADLFLFPTYHREGLPYCVLESLAAGTPMITTRVAGIPDVVIDGIHGRLIEPKDPQQIVAAIRVLAGSSAALQQMSRDCAARAADAFSLERLALRFEEVYEKLEVPRGVTARREI
jgi:glycosyltransferase involved in cell wall biosynthesis